MKKPGRPLAEKKMVLLSVRVPEELVVAMKEYLRGNRPPPTPGGIVRTALEDFLSAKGYWPMKEGSNAS